jgi:hypothetical protein
VDHCFEETAIALYEEQQRVDVVRAMDWLVTEVSCYLPFAQISFPNPLFDPTAAVLTIG